MDWDRLRRLLKKKRAHRQRLSILIILRGRYRAAGRTEKESFCCGHTGGWNSGHGFGEKIARFYGDSDVKVLNFGLKKEFLDRYNPEDVMQENHLTAEQIAEDVLAVLK